MSQLCCQPLALGRGALGVVVRGGTPYKCNLLSRHALSTITLTVCFVVLAVTSLPWRWLGWCVAARRRWMVVVVVVRAFIIFHDRPENCQAPASTTRAPRSRTAVAAFLPRRL